MVEKYVEIISAILSIIITATTVLLSIHNSNKKEEKAEKLQKIIEMAKVLEEIPKYVKEAEQLFEGKGKGNLKMNYVLKEIRNECLIKNVEYNENEENFKQKIEQILETPQKGE